MRLGLLLGLLLGLPMACSSSGEAALQGSLCTVFDCSHDRVEIVRQPDAVIIRYKKQPAKGAEFTQVKVVAKLPLEAGRVQQLQPGQVDRGGQPEEFGVLTEGTVTFDAIGTAQGEQTSGKFFATFKSSVDSGGQGTTEGTVNGEFSGPLDAVLGQ